MANVFTVFAHGVGMVNLFSFLSIDNVFYVPSSSFNLLSISHLTRSLDRVISFTKISICLQDKSSRQVIGTKCESHGLYHLRSSTHVHAQLGHPSLITLEQLVPTLSKLSSLVCESCQLGKDNRSSFPSSVSQRASSPFALVQFDIWRLSRIKSNLGFQYFVTFIDDYSICT